MCVRARPTSSALRGVYVAPHAFASSLTRDAKRSLCNGNTTTLASSESESESDTIAAKAGRASFGGGDEAWAEVRFRAMRAAKNLRRENYCRGEGRGRSMFHALERVSIT